MRKGFTLIELMIVIAIIAILAAIAIPNLMASRIRANETTAVSVLKQYATAQVTFQIGRQGRNTANTFGGNNGYCSSFPNLCYGLPVGGSPNVDYLNLINEAVARATLDVSKELPAMTNKPTGLAAAPGAASPEYYQGFAFHSDRTLTNTAVGQSDFTSDFALVAVPQSYRSGNNMYWLGQPGTVYLQGINSSYSAAEVAADATPQDPAGITNWATL